LSDRSRLRHEATSPHPVNGITETFSDFFSKGSRTLSLSLSLWCRSSIQTLYRRFLPLSRSTSARLRLLVFRHLCWILQFETSRDSRCRTGLCHRRRSRRPELGRHGRLRGRLLARGRNPPSTPHNTSLLGATLDPSTPRPQPHTLDLSTLAQAPKAWRVAIAEVVVFTSGDGSLDGKEADSAMLPP
jgi:hypothetical protein